MTQAYGQLFSNIYSKGWGEFASKSTPGIIEFYEKQPISRQNKNVLDLCCGTGEFASICLERGYQLVGLDLSEHMLHHARERTKSYGKRASFLQGDVAEFSLDTPFGLAVSTYDSMNHLDRNAFLSCCRCTFSTLADDGLFIFDYNTKAALMTWNSVTIENSEDYCAIIQGSYDEGSDHGSVKCTGFMRLPNGLFERSEQWITNYAFDIEWVHQSLIEIGWREVYCAEIDNLALPIKDAEKNEKENSVFFVAHK